MMKAVNRNYQLKALSMIIMALMLASLFVPMAKASEPGTNEVELTPNEGEQVLGEGALSLSLTSPVLLDGNTDLANWASSNGFAGSGSEEDPIVIDGLDISIPYYATCGYAFTLKNTDLHVLINNSYFYNTKNVASPYEIGAGIVLLNGLMRRRSSDRRRAEHPGQQFCHLPLILFQHRH
jgi:hypothetical protein